MGVNKRLFTKGMLQGGNNVVRLVMESKRLLDAMELKRARVLSRTGGFARITMQRSMRYRKGPSNPPNPPHSHRTKTNNKPGALRNTIIYQVQSDEETVICGPIAFRSKVVPLNRDTVPQLHDMGGVAVVHRRNGATTNVYPARPFTKPAFDKTYQFFKNLIEDLPLLTLGNAETSGDVFNR